LPEKSGRSAHARREGRTTKISRRGEIRFRIVELSLQVFAPCGWALSAGFVVVWQLYGAVLTAPIQVHRAEDPIPMHCALYLACTTRCMLRPALLLPFRGLQLVTTLSRSLAMAVVPRSSTMSPILGHSGQRPGGSSRPQQVLAASMTSAKCWWRCSTMLRWLKLSLVPRSRNSLSSCGGCELDRLRRVRPRLRRLMYWRPAGPPQPRRSGPGLPPPGTNRESYRSGPGYPRWCPRQGASDSHGGRGRD